MGVACRLGRYCGRRNPGIGVGMHSMPASVEQRECKRSAHWADCLRLGRYRNRNGRSGKLLRCIQERMRGVSKRADKRFGNDLGRDTHKELGLFLRFHSRWGLLVMGTLGSDFLTEWAGMFAIEGLLNCSRHRSCARIIPDHGGPCHALLKGKVTPCRKEKGRCHHHGHDAIPNLHRGLDNQSLQFRQSKSMNRWKTSTNRRS